MDSKRIRNVDISQIHHLPMIDFIGNDFAIFNDIKDMPLSSYPTRLNAACLTVCLKGWCKLELNLQQCEMREGMLGIILPDQIVFQLHLAPKKRVILLKRLGFLRSDVNEGPLLNHEKHREKYG